MTDLEKIPPPVKDLAQWVCFRHDKTPVNPKTGGNAQSNNPTTWGTIEQALKHFQAHKGNGIAGVGFEFSTADPYAGIDLDKCRNPETGEIEPWAQAIIDHLSSYTELSPSGCGFHILVKGAVPSGGNKKGKVEMYSHGRYFTMTGHHLEGTPTTIEPRQAQLEALHTEIFGKPKGEGDPKETGPGLALEMSDRELIEKAQAARNGDKFSQLWRGDSTGYYTPSEATAALLKLLVFWWGDDPARVDRLFRQSGLMRPKWDRPQSGSTWGALEIQKAIDKATEFYKAPKARSKKSGQKKEATTTGGFSLSDLGNARRLVAQHGQDLRYCHLSSRWWWWTAKVWQEDHSGVAPSLAKKTVASIYTEAAAAGEDFRKALASHALRSESTSRIAGMLSLAESEPGIPVQPDEWDSDPWLLNCLSGTIDLKSGKLRPHNRSDMITRMAPVEYDPTATCPLFLEFLNRIMGGNQNLINFLQKILGYSLTGSTREQCLFFLYGLGANGKSTLLEVVQSLWGDYATRTSSETFLAKKPGGIPNDVAALRGARLAAAVEVEQGRRLAEVLIKEMTGGDTISARFMRSEWFSFKPRFKIFLATNHKPIIRGTDFAIWRRIRLIPFAVQIPKEEQDRDLSEKLKAELSGILNWIMAGCLQWRFGGLDPPQEVETATQDYRAEMDVLGGFMAERCIVDPGASATAAELYKSYTSWAEENGEKRPLTQRAFGMNLTERGFERARGTAGRIVWRDIGLKTE